MPARMEWRATDPDANYSACLEAGLNVLGMVLCVQRRVSTFPLAGHHDIKANCSRRGPESRPIMGARNLPRLKKQKISEGEDGRETIE